MQSKLIFSFGSVFTMLQLIAKPSFLLNWMVHKRMGRKGAFLSELELFFQARNNCKKHKTQQSNIPLIWKRLQSFLTINQKSCLVLDEGIQRKKKWKEHFLGELTLLKQKSKWVFKTKNNNQTNLFALKRGCYLHRRDVFYPERRQKRKDDKEKRIVLEKFFCTGMLTSPS